MKVKLKVLCCIIAICIVSIPLYAVWHTLSKEEITVGNQARLLEKMGGGRRV